MSQIMLLSSTGVEQVDQTARRAIDLLERHFPTRVRGYYLVGSYAVGEAIPTSDVDIVVMFKGAVGDAERQRFAHTLEECRRDSPCPIDLTAGGELRFRQVGGVWFQTASRLLYGEDIRPSIPRKPVATHMRDLMHALYPLLARVRGDPPQLTVPLEYPDPAGTLYGYDRRQLRLLDGTSCASTKDVVLIVLGAASALTLLAAGRYVGGGKKSEIAAQYRIWVGDEWADLVEEIYERGRNQWAYRVPQRAADRRRLRELCARVLAFENHFLDRYQPFVLAELQHPDQAIQLFAARRLGQVIYRDPTVVAALGAAAASGSAELRQAARDTLRQYGERATDLERTG